MIGDIPRRTQCLISSEAIVDIALLIAPLCGRELHQDGHPDAAAACRSKLPWSSRPQDIVIVKSVWLAPRICPDFFHHCNSLPSIAAFLQHSSPRSGNNWQRLSCLKWTLKPAGRSCWLQDRVCRCSSSCRASDTRSGSIQFQQWPIVVPTQDGLLRRHAWHDSFPQIQ